MDIKTVVSKDVWDAIKDNYERESYTTAISNLIQYINEVVQEKSGLDNVDNTSLMEQAFFRKPPSLQINKGQTRVEKDVQEGIGHLLKGACLAIRNPRAHQRQNDTRDTADRIILFYDYVLGFVRKSNQPQLVDDWLTFVFDSNFTNTKKYAELILEEIPAKKKYDLLVNIFRCRDKATPYKINNLVNGLLEQITSEEYAEFMDGLNKELLTCKNDGQLKMFFGIFPVERWNELIPLVKLRIENIVQESISKAEPIYEECGYNDYVYDEMNKEAMPSIWAARFIDAFEEDTKKTIFFLLEIKANKNKDLDDNYIFKYFDKYVKRRGTAKGADDFAVIDDSEDLPF